MAENNIEIVKRSLDDEYILVRFDDRYFIIDNTNDEKELIHTPGGETLNTMYISLAERLFDDVQQYGPESMSPNSLLPWQYTLCENFIHMTHEEIESMLDLCFMQKPDWTFDIGSDEWSTLFGSKRSRIKEIRDWLSKCTHMQMTAACCIGNAYNSINIAFILAWLMENYAGNERKKQLKAFAEIISENSFYGPLSDIVKAFNNFNLYYGIHLDEDGTIIDRPFSDLCGETFDLFDVSEEMLVGRNYYHYINGVMDEKQPFLLNHDLSSFVSDSDEDAEENEENGELSEFIPNDCWVKYIGADEEDSEVYYIIALQVENGKVNKITALLDEVTRMGSGMFFIPGMSMPGTHSYDEISIDDYDVIEEEIQALKKGRFIPNNFTFVGKKLPKSIIEISKYNNDDTLYMICQQSAYRLAYMNMFINTDEKGIVNDFDYSTYQSSGSSFGDMFSRPQGISDLNKEAIDVLLYVYDAYTDEEIEKL